MSFTLTGTNLNAPDAALLAGFTVGCLVGPSR